MEQILCRVAESSCLPTHNIVPHISLHDQPCHKTMKKYDDFEGMVISLHHPLKFTIRTWFVIVHNIFAYFALSFSAAQVYMIQERCWFSQIDFFVEYFPHRIKILFLSSQFYVIHIHRKEKSSFTMNKESFPIWNFLPSMFH